MNASSGILGKDAGSAARRSVRARLVRPQAGQSVLDYPWSSVAGGYALPVSKRPQWLAVEAGMAAFDCKDTVAGRRRMVERLDRRAVREEIQSCGVPVMPSEVDARCSHLRRGWYWGTQGFAEKMRAMAEKVVKKTAPKSRAYRGMAQCAKSDKFSLCNEEMMSIAMRRRWRFHVETVKDLQFQAAAVPETGKRGSVQKLTNSNFPTRV